MPTTFSKPMSHEAAFFKRTYDEPIPFVPIVDKANVQKPKDIKIPLRQNPNQANSPKVEKVFTEFVENSPEAFCRWRCDTEEYIRGAGINQPAAKVQAGMQLLSQAHKTTWENIVQAQVPGGQVTTEAAVEEIFQAFALTFMSPTARRKQKRYMSSGSVSKPKNWSSRQVANRLTTLNRYLQYLPGNAAEFTEDELKDMLVDLHSPTYQNLMARANYDMDTQSFLQVTQYLQNLSLIEESFNKGGSNKHHGNSEAKAHKAGNKNRKHGKNHCRKNPHGDHTWADCFDNPKGKNYKGNKPNNGNKNNFKKAEARNMDTDSDADMDQALQIVNIDVDEVRTLSMQVEAFDFNPESSTNSTCPPTVATVNKNSLLFKEAVPFDLPKKTKCTGEINL